VSARPVEGTGCIKPVDFLASIEALQAEALASGYLTPNGVENNLRLSFPHSDYGLEFKVQINRARSEYAAKHPLPAGAECRICLQNEGSPGKENLRVFPFLLSPGREFFFQWTPFPLFPQHGVVIQTQHSPMRMDRQTLEDGAAFQELAPAYSWFSNSDLPETGASILEHLHYQVGRNTRLPVMSARSRKSLLLGSFEVHWLEYPLAAIRLVANTPADLLNAAEKLVSAWKAQLPGKHSLNLCWRWNESGHSELTLLFRSRAHLTPEPLRRYKTEGIGVIEAGGEIILPVPTGPEALEIHNEIVHQGQSLCLGILSGIDPWKLNGSQQFAKLTSHL